MALKDIAKQSIKQVVKRMTTSEMAQDMARMKAVQDLKVKPPSDNVANVRNANFTHPRTIGNQTVNIKDLTGGVRMSDPKEVQRVKALADKIASPEGYISRIIVDHNNNVVEGQHRLEALRQLGVKDVPVYKIEDLAETMPVDQMKSAIKSVGNIHPDHVYQLTQRALEDISEGGIKGARELDYGAFQKHYDAALDAADKTEAPAYNEISGMVSKMGEEGRSPIIPAPNRWFLHPDKFPNQQKLIERVLQKTGKSREDFPSGAFIDPRTGDVLDSRIMEDLGVVIDPKTNRPMMSAKGESGIEQLDPKTGAFTKSNLVRKGLFKPEGGDPLLNDLSFLATIEKGDVGHKYGLATEYASPTELFNTGTGANPTLRPRSRGDLFGIGEVVGKARVGSGEPHDVYEKLFVAPKGSDVQGVKLSKANGGAITEDGVDHLAGGGLKGFIKEPLKQAVKRVATSVLPAAEREANLAKMLERSNFQDRMYHGTGDDFKEFEPNSFFAFNPKVANSYAESRGKGIHNSGSNVMPVHLNVTNPANEKDIINSVLELGLLKKNELIDPSYQWITPSQNIHADKVIDHLKRKGYDGVEVPDMDMYGNEIYSVQVFDPKNVKSAIGNRGTYDVTDPDITKAEGGAVHLAGGGLKGFIKEPLKQAVKRIMPKTSFEMAHDLARMRASLPVEKGGLGLPPNNTSEDRARAMGINTPMYHASKQNISGSFVPGYNDNLAFTTDNPKFANDWIGKGKLQVRSGDEAKKEIKEAEDQANKIRYGIMNFEELQSLEGKNFHDEYDRRSALAREAHDREVGIPTSKLHGTIYPLNVEANKTFHPVNNFDELADYFTAKGITPKQAEDYKTGNYLFFEKPEMVNYLKGKGYDSMRLNEFSGEDFPTLAVFNPETIRSRFAANDPFRRDAATAAAMGVAAPDLLAKEPEKKSDGGVLNLQRPAFGNPNMLAQGKKMNLPQRQAYSAETPDWMAKGLPMEGRATILPFRDTGSKREVALPGIVASALNSMTAPGRAFSGSDPTFDPMSEGIDFALNTMGGGMAASKAAPVGDGLLGMHLWHGSPHKFPPTAKNPLGEFDPMKIGTGEGAQAYGVGAGYLAEAKKVADEYAGKLSKKMVSIEGFGNKDVERLILDRLSSRVNATQYGSGSQAALDDLISISRHGNQEEKIAANAMLNKIGPFGMPVVKDSGSLYKVDLADEQIPKMLDWDKPLSQQHPDVIKAISADPRIARLIENGKIDNMYQNGGEFYRAINSKYANDFPAHISVDEAENAAQVKASKYLQEQGISGIRYLDGGSRANGEGTSNFVVFDPAHMNILERKADGGVLHLAGGGLKGYIKEPLKQTVKRFIDPKEISSLANEYTQHKANIEFNRNKVINQTPVRISKVLAPHEGKYMSTAGQADRLAPDYGGGAGFIAKQLYDPQYKGHGWMVTNQTTGSGMLNPKNYGGELPDIFIPQVGGEKMLYGNPLYFNEVLNTFRHKVAQGDVPSEQIEKINQALRNLKTKNFQTKEMEPVFDPNINILDPYLGDIARTFGKRTKISEILGGKGAGGELNFDLVDHPALLEKYTDPTLKGVPTGYFGNYMFYPTGTGGIKSGLNTNYLYSIHGEAEPQVFNPAPANLLFPKWEESVEMQKGRPVTSADYRAGSIIYGRPTEQITDELLTNLQKKGFKLSLIHI